MKLSDEQAQELVNVISAYRDWDMVSMRYGFPQALYRALLADAKAQNPPFLSRDPTQLYIRAVNNRWPSVRGEVASMREP